MSVSASRQRKNTGKCVEMGMKTVWVVDSDKISFPRMCGFRIP